MTSTAATSPIPVRPTARTARLTPAHPPRRHDYYWLVKTAKWVLLALIAASITAGVTWPQLWPAEGRVRIGISLVEDSGASAAELNRLVEVTTDRLNGTISDIDEPQSDGDSVLGARFIGADSNGRPFYVNAELIQTSSDLGPKMLLTAPDGEMTLDDGTRLTIVADAGVYNEETQMMTLVGNVVLVHDNTYEVSTESASIDLDAMTASGSDPVIAEGPAGTVAAEGFEVGENGQNIVFTGDARAIISSGSGASF